MTHARLLATAKILFAIAGVLIMVDLAPPGFLLALGIVLRSLGLILSLTFVLRYSRQPWRSTPEGRHLMSFSVIVVLCLAFITVNNITAALDPYVPPGRVDGDWPGRLVIVVLLYGGIAWTMWRRNRLLTLALREPR